MYVSIDLSMPHVVAVVIVVETAAPCVRACIRDLDMITQEVQLRSIDLTSHHVRQTGRLFSSEMGKERKKERKEKKKEESPADH